MGRLAWRRCSAPAAEFDGSKLKVRVVTPERIVVADYKTSRAPPAAPDDVPVLYLRQMAAYRAVLALLYPGRAIVCLLIWTEGPTVMELPAALLAAHTTPAPALQDA